jgi:hypothetical protein
MWVETGTVQNLLTLMAVLDQAELLQAAVTNTTTSQSEPEVYVQPRSDFC